MLLDLIRHQYIRQFLSKKDGMSCPRAAPGLEHRCVEGLRATLARALGLGVLVAIQAAGVEAKMPAGRRSTPKPYFPKPGP